MTTKYYNPLLCPRNDFPYSDTALQQVIDREQIVRSQHQSDIISAGDAAKERGQYSQHKPCRLLASEAVPKIIDGVQAVLNKLETKSATHDKQNIADLAGQPWRAFCAIAFTTMLDSTIQQNTLAASITKVAKNCEIEAKLSHYEEYAKKFYDRIMTQQHQSGRNVDHIAAAMTVAMNRRAEGVYGDAPMPELEWVRWTEPYKRWLGNLLIQIVVNTTGLFEVKVLPYSKMKYKGARLEATDELLDWLDKAEQRIGMFGGFFLPLPVPPRDWTDTQTGGFWTAYGGQRQLVKNFSKGFQEELLNLTEQYSKIVFPAVNAAQHTAWRINERVYDTMYALWDQNAVVAGLPNREKIPLPVCPKCGKVPDRNHSCFRNDKNILTTWKMSAAKAHHENIRLRSLRLALGYGLQVAELLKADERFYYVYQTDFRGRLYPCAQLNPQGTDWQKGLLEFADGVALGKNGAKWLAVHIANCWGNDKVSFDARYQWVLDNESWILDCANHPLDCLQWVDADSPCCFLAACFEWAQYKVEGDSYKSHVAVALDGSCSGIQHYSAMLRDEVGALATNVKMLPGATKKEDIYQKVADTTNELLKKDINDPETGKWAVLVLGNKMIDRKTVKRAVMTLPYGSTYSSCHDYVTDELYPKLLESDLPEVEVVKACRYVSGIVWQAIPMVVQAARVGMDYLQKLARLVAKEALPVTWTTPTGFVVQQSYYEQEGDRIYLATGGSIMLKNNTPVWQSSDFQRITFAKLNKRIDPKKQVSGIAPNFIHSLDSSHLMITVKTAHEAGIDAFALIHDSLGTHAGNTDRFIEIIRRCFYDLYNEHDPIKIITEHLASQMPEDMKKKLPEIPERGNLDIKEILSAQYLFA